MAPDRGRVYGGQSEDERRAERRERLLGAGLALFGTNGWDGTSIERICAESGVSTRYFYEEFRGREDLLEVVFTRVGGQAVAHTLEALREPGTAEVRVARAVRAYVLHVTADPGCVRLLYQDARRLPSVEAVRLRLLLDFWQQVPSAWADGVDPAWPEPIPDLPMVRARAITGAVNEVLTHWLSTPEPRPDVRGTAELLVRTITPAVLRFSRAA